MSLIAGKIIVDFVIEGRKHMTNKVELRKRILKIRQNLAPEYMKECSERIVNRLLQIPQYQNASHILFYMPIRHEVDVRDAIEVSWKKGKKVVLPRVRAGKKEMDGYLVERWEDLEEGSYGILEPIPNPMRLVNPEEISLVVTPGVAFDRQGFRLGYGGGYYDRFFAQSNFGAWRIGVAYPEQIVSTTYPEAHDFRMHMVLTSDEMIVP